MNPLISIIVPVHNVIHYIERCLDSIVNQTYKNLEIILVDDGGVDGSADICDMYARKDSRIIVLHESNTGATQARKKGIARSSGQYIGFVDSDDWIEHEMFAHMMEKMLAHNVDFVFVRHSIEYQSHVVLSEAGTEGVYLRNAEDTKCTYHHMFPWDSDNQMKMTTLLWDKLFRREIIEKYYMNVPDDISYIEDSACVYGCLPYVNSIYVSNVYCCHYNQQNALSITKTLGKDYQRVADATKLYSYLHSVYKNHEAESDILEQLYLYIMKLMLLVSPLSNETSIVSYLFPYEHIINHRKVIIYGAGKVGISYYKQFKKLVGFDVIYIIDKNAYGTSLLDTTIETIDIIQQKSYDVIVVAVDRENLANAIVDELTTEYQVQKEKIIWKKPHHIFDGV